MTNAKNTKRALLTSVMALILCMSMLVGTTFAWFTDEVTSTGNIIKTGTLDAEMYWKDADTDWTDASKGAIFNYQYWEPGYTDVKFINVKNVGDLAFKYRLNVIPNIMPTEGEENLAEVLKVYCMVFEGETFEPAKDFSNMVYLGTLKDLMGNDNGADTGVILPADGKGSTDVELPENTEAYVGAVTVCLALHMDEGADNKYMNLSVGEGFSVQLLATQFTYENDYFDNMYDEGAKFDEAPRANVKETGAQQIETSTHGTIWANTTFQFLPTETYEQAQQNAYKYYHADFVVYADADIAANAVILPGYYAAYCDDYNDGKWIGLSSDEVITEGTQIRLVDTLAQLLGGTVYVNYEEICKWGNDNVGFLCGVSAVDDGQGNYIAAGTTITVELRLYETYSEEEAIEKFGVKSTNYETGEYIIIGTYTYTVPNTVPNP